jgi:hypothetical protein
VRKWRKEGTSEKSSKCGNNVKMISSIWPYLLGVMFNEQILCKHKTYSFTYSAIPHSYLEPERETYFCPVPQSLKSRKHSSGSNWIGLIPTQHLLHTSTLIPTIEVTLPVRVTLTSTGDTDTGAVPSRTHWFTLNIQTGPLLRVIQ